MPHNDLRATIAKELATIKGEKGNVPMEDVSGILEKLVDAITPGGSATEAFLRDEITKIAHHIQTTKNEILALSPGTENSNHIGSAAIQLDAVVKATEEAAHTIMDAADEIQNTVGASSDETLKQQITDITARIYEACNFQDLTGQRIKKVMQALDFTESKIQKLIGLFSSDGTIQPEEISKMSKEDDDLLMNGPQLPSNAPSQAEIDAMFGKLSN